MTGTFSHLELRGRFDTYGEALIEKKTFKKNDSVSHDTLQRYRRTPGALLAPWGVIGNCRSISGYARSPLKTLPKFVFHRYAKGKKKIREKKPKMCQCRPCRMLCLFRCHPCPPVPSLPSSAQSLSICNLYKLDY